MSGTTVTYSIAPKPVNSPKLRDHRFEVVIMRPKGDGTNHMNAHTVLRYATEKAARKVAVELPADEEHATVDITYYSARDNWQPHAVARRKNGEWLPGNGVTFR